MKKKIILVLFCGIFGAVSLQAQVRIGGTQAPNQSAVLDLNPTDNAIIDKAFVLPRVNLQSTSTQTLTEALIGMTVYNMATVADVTPGIYYWTGTKWERVTSKLGDIINYISFGDSLATYLNQTFLTDSIVKLINQNETVTTLTKNNNGTYTYKSEDNTITVIDVVGDIFNYGDTLLSNNSFVTNMGDSIAKYIYITNLGDSIRNYITQNVNQEFTDSIMKYVNIEGERGIVVDGSGTSNIKIKLPTGTLNHVLSFDGTNWVSTPISTLTVSEVDGVIGNEVVGPSDATLILSGAGTADDPLKLRANTTAIADSIAKNISYTALGDTIIKMIGNSEIITTLTDNNNGTYTYKSEDNTLTKINVVGDIYQYGDTLLSNNQFITNLGDTLLSNNQFVTHLGDTLLSNNQFITNMGDSIAKYIHITNLGDTVLNYITQNVNQEFTDSIMKHVNIEGERGITVTGSGTSDITVGLPAGTTNGQILVWNSTNSTWEVSSPNSVIKRLEITVDAAVKDSVHSRLLSGTSSVSTKGIRVVSVQPSLLTSGGFDEIDLDISTSAKVVGDAISWTVRIANENYVTSRKYGVEKVYVYYICEDVLTPNTFNSRNYTQPITSIKTIE